MGHIWRYECPECDYLIYIQPTNCGQPVFPYQTICKRCNKIQDFNPTNGLTIKYRDKNFI